VADVNGITERVGGWLAATPGLVLGDGAILAKRISLLTDW